MSRNSPHDPRRDVSREASSDPSRWSHRLPLVCLALIGAAIAAYLAAFQMKIADVVWDPIFGGGTERILTSDVARSLPIPDAALGMAGYIVEAGLGLAYGPFRWRDHPWVVLVFGGVAGLMALAGIGLVLLQVFAFGTGCTLCLASAAISIVLAIGAWPEVAAAAERVGWSTPDLRPRSFGTASHGGGRRGAAGNHEHGS